MAATPKPARKKVKEHIAHVKKTVMKRSLPKAGKESLKKVFNKERIGELKKVYTKEKKKQMMKWIDWEKERPKHGSKIFVWDNELRNMFLITYRGSEEPWEGFKNHPRFPLWAYVETEE